ncbi:MAG TPA: alpha/beta hydrolase [Acidimicrobiales bacterium]|jgi:pimeloyl-ACP methyl ester carboxylesterase|nr:alpha/beta hydrolase [Acidimicrobiales bacterium]
MTATLVLVHGGFHGAWCWERVTELLGQSGVPFVAVDLPSSGAHAVPPGDLHTDARAVTDVVEAIDGEIVLVGHSYGGAVITEAGLHPKVRHLVYITAMQLDEGASCITATPGVDAPVTEIAAALQPGEDPTMVVLDPAIAGPAFYSDCDDATLEWAVSRLVPQPMETMTQCPERIAWRHCESTYVVCAADRVVHPIVQRALAGRATHCLEWGTGHFPLLSRPDLVAELLSRIAA